MSSFEVVALCCVLLSCSRGANDDGTARAQVERDMKAFISKNVDIWLLESKALEAALPAPRGRGWDLEDDAASLTAAKAAWGRARHAYELIEGAIAPIFPESDAATDARYEDYLAAIGPAGDRNPFDADGVVGMHGLERILWADGHPADVIAFEQGLPGYRKAAFPANEAEALAVKHQLAAGIVAEVEKLKAQFEPLTLDIAFAFRGLVDLAVEQVEKVDLAQSGREESRYAQITMRDLRANLEGCRTAYEVFRPWLRARGGKAEDEAVLTAFARLEAAYAAVHGDALPRPPAGWSSLQPSHEHLETPFGRLFQVVKSEADDNVQGSLHASLLVVAELLKLPKTELR